MPVEILKQGTDNWAHILYKKNGAALAIDPLDESVYLKFLEEKNLRLAGILCTHYHPDHIEGVEGILKKYSVPVIGPNTFEAPSFVTQKVLDGPVTIDEFQIESFFLPGHSKSHCLYQEKTKNLLFVGDILFHLGCGRVFDCTPDILFESLQELKEFPISSEIFVGHDYRQANLRFCNEIKPKFYASLNLGDLDKSTSLEMELWWNPFLKTNSFDEWWELRQKRNTFK
ncbi:MAG: MBL fold metallo-hydrolase [Bdellovibrionota bacterium]